ncbi:MAG: WYL domain-containing protein [Rhizobiales bacterium]|nr:WYL domain-containing protein [Hyphomicrobiales bacterium]
MPQRRQTLKTIEAAIAGRLRLAFVYKDVVRVAEPHVLGFDSHGNLALSAWQVSGTGAGWRLFHLDRIQALVETDDRFADAATGYNPQDPTFATVLRRL